MSSPLDIHIDDSTGSAENANENGDTAVLIPPCLGSAAQERSPFDDLPTELTENILTLVVWAYDQRNFKLVETRTKYDIRTRLSLVCNSWKEVIRGISTLWNNLWIDERTPLIRIENSLKRSKESGLYISLRLHRHAPVFDGIWSLIAPHVTRLVDFYFDCGCISTGFCRLNGDPANGLRHVLHELAVAGKAPRLKRLGLKLCDHKGSDPEDTGYSVASLFGGQTPALTHLKLHGVNVDWEGMEWSKALEDLKLERHMESARPSYATFARVLSSFPKLKTLELDESGPSGSPKDWPSDPAITALYTVENLFLADQKCAYACALLQRFAFPNLKSLTLNLRGYLTPGIHQNYDDLIHTLCSRGPATGKFSGEPEERRWATMVSEIEHLHLFNIRLSLTAARKLYNCLDNLRTLTLRVNELWPQVPMFMDLLDPASERSADCSKDGVRLPRLESLIIVNAKQEQVQQFMEVRDRRAAVGYPLKRLLTRHLQTTREV